MIDLENLTIGYRKDDPLVEVSLSLPENGIYAVVGKNGSGKSSFYKTLMGILPPLGGEISGIQQEDVLLISDYTGLPGEVRLKDLCDLLLVTKEDIENVLDGQPLSIYDQPIQHLSSGQKKIAEITLGLLRRKKVLLFDEAANALDDENTHQFHECIQDASASALVLYTTHNLQEIIDLQIPILCIRDKKIILYEPARDVNEIREIIGSNTMGRKSK